MNPAAGVDGAPDVGGAARSACCPGCGSPELVHFYAQRGVPVTSNRPYLTPEEALACPRGEIDLAYCRTCTLVTNTAFNGSPVQDAYESSQAASPRFLEHARDVARRWIERHHLQGATALEIGCGRGEFLAEWCAISGGRGVGVDPVLASVPTAERPTQAGLEWRAASFSAEQLTADVRAVLCRHTLEHIPDVATFLLEVRGAMTRPDTILLLEVPDILPILQHGAFWDVYYEHCIYFSIGSLTRILQHAGFDVVRIEHAYDGQYLIAEARPAPAGGTATAPGAAADDSAVMDAINAFTDHLARQRRQLHETLEAIEARHESVALWGAGSKATAYLTMLPRPETVSCVVDLNSRKQGTFIAGSGHPVVAPAHLREARPDAVLMMNPIYRQEIAALLDELGVDTRLMDPGAL